MEGEGVFVEGEGYIGGVVGAADVEGEGSQSGHNGGVFADTGCVFGESRISDVVGTVFDAPMPADGFGGFLGIEPAC